MRPDRMTTKERRKQVAKLAPQMRGEPEWRKRLAERLGCSACTVAGDLKAIKSSSPIG